jgi:ABC-type Zn uptake system ZnuABC Zn-binding protein ZnuA
MKPVRVWWPVFGLVLLIGLGGCRAETMDAAHTDEIPELAAVSLAEGEKLGVMATTSIVADVVGRVGGDRIALQVLLPLGADPHAFEPTPQDVTSVADAHAVFINGAGLEAFLGKLLESVGEEVTVIPVSYGVDLIALEAHEEDEHEEDEHDHSGEVDPHTWFDPNNVIVWAHNISQALAALDPENAGVYAANAEAYEAELVALDTWIREQVARVPEGSRTLVTDHASFGYLARRYGFEQVGAVFPGYSTLAAPSARDLAALEDAIMAHGVRAVYVGLTVNPDLAQRVAEDTGTSLVYLYAGSLSEKGGPADNYVSMMRYNVSAIVDSLR